MTVNELVSLTGISESEIETYYQGGLIGREENGEKCFNCCDAKQIGLIRKLEQFKMSKREIETFFTLCQKGDTQKAVRILQNIREHLIIDIQEAQKSLDVLDCIIYETKNKYGGTL